MLGPETRRRFSKFSSSAPEASTTSTPLTIRGKNSSTRFRSSLLSCGSSASTPTSWKKLRRAAFADPALSSPVTANGLLEFSAARLPPWGTPGLPASGVLEDPQALILLADVDEPTGIHEYSGPNF